MARHRRGRGTGGTPSGRGRRPSPKPTQPPFLTFDPAISAESRAAQRGLGDIEADTATARRFGKRDLVQALRDIRVGTGRKRQDIGRSFEDSERKLGYQEQDVQLRARRANEDFDTQLADIGRQFAQLGQRQREGANAAGVLGGGTEAAGAAARAQNQRLAEAPIGVARQRVGDDLFEALSRIGEARGELGSDRDLALGRLGADRNRDRRLTRRQAGRERFDLKRKLERARREAAISKADLLAQAIYAAQQNRPGAFDRRGRRKKGR